MNIKISSNIATLRKEHTMTQAQVAEYIGVSPQAVSKWELGEAFPDVYLLPRLAYLFNVSLDTLFGVSNLASTELLVEKYLIVPTDQHYKAAKDAVLSLIDMEESVEAYHLLEQIEMKRSYEHVIRSKEACLKMIELCENDVCLAGHIELVKVKALLREPLLTDNYMATFASSQSMDDFLILLTALYENHEYEELFRWVEDYPDMKTKDPSQGVYRYMFLAALALTDYERMKALYSDLKSDTDKKEVLFDVCFELYQWSKDKDTEEAHRYYKELTLLLARMNISAFKRSVLEEKIQ